jgi:hypothetical protein
MLKKRKNVRKPALLDILVALSADHVSTYLFELGGPKFQIKLTLSHFYV